jgi:hypothetical protein
VLNPTPKEQLQINSITERYDALVSEILRFLDRYPLQKARFAYLENEAESYLRFGRVGRDLDENTWKKIFIREFTEITSKIAIFMKELAESIENSFKYKCFRTARDCNLDINYDKRSVFVIMPFDESLRDCYQIGIKETLTELGYDCNRADEIIHTRDILCNGVCKPIQEATIIIADLTTKNANVFFELGLAYGFEKEVLLVAKTIDDIPFDLRSMNSIIYNGSITTLRDGVKRKISKIN